jgi:hypothetical protein
MDMNMVILSWDQMCNLHWERSLNVVFPPVSIKDHTVDWIVCVETLQLATCSGKPKTLVILSCERPTAHWEWRDGESSVYPRGQGLYWRCTYSRLALDPVMFWRIWVKVDICRLESYICHVVRDPQLGIIGSNRRCSSIMETRFFVHHRS